MCKNKSSFALRNRQPPTSTQATMATNQSNSKTAADHAKDIAEMWKECVADEAETLQQLTTMKADEYDWDETVPEEMREEVWRLLQELWTTKKGEEDEEEEDGLCSSCWCDKAIGTYGDDEAPLCEDCKVEGGFCSCGGKKEECPLCAEEAEEEA